MMVQHTPRAKARAGRFPNRIREYRLKSGVSQRELATRVGFSRSVIARWECGHTLPTLPNAFRLARALDTLAESLYVGMYTGTTRPPVAAKRFPR